MYDDLMKINANLSCRIFLFFQTCLQINDNMKLPVRKMFYTFLSFSLFSFTRMKNTLHISSNRKAYLPQITTFCQCPTKLLIESISSANYQKLSMSPLITKIPLIKIK